MTYIKGTFDHYIELIVNEKPENEMRNGMFPIDIDGLYVGGNIHDK